MSGVQIPASPPHFPVTGDWALVSGCRVAPTELPFKKLTGLEGLFYFDRLFYDAAGVCCSSTCAKNFGSSHKIVPSF